MDSSKPTPEMIAATLANRICQLHSIRDASGDCGFRDFDGKMVRIEWWTLQAELTKNLLEAMTRKDYWGEWSDGRESRRRTVPASDVEKGL